MTEEKIKQYIKEAHQNAVDKGLYDCPECGGICLMKYHLDIPNYYSQRPDDKCRTCKGTVIDPNKNIGELLQRVNESICLAGIAHRRGRFADWDNLEKQFNFYTGSAFKHWQKVGGFATLYEQNIKDTFEDEIADVFIRLFDLCGYLEIEPELLNSYNPSENIGSDLLRATMIVSQLWPLLRLDLDRKEIAKEYSFASGDIIKFLSDFCQHHNIPIEKHIDAKMAYDKPNQHGKDY